MFLPVLMPSISANTTSKVGRERGSSARQDRPTRINARGSLTTGDKSAADDRRGLVVVLVGDGPRPASSKDDAKASLRASALEALIVLQPSPAIISTSQLR